MVICGEEIQVGLETSLPTYSPWKLTQQVCRSKNEWLVPDDEVSFLKVGPFFGGHSFIFGGVDFFLNSLHFHHGVRGPTPKIVEKSHPQWDFFWEEHVLKKEDLIIMRKIGLKQKRSPKWIVSTFPTINLASQNLNSLHFQQSWKRKLLPNLTLPETNSKSTWKWMVGIRSGFLLGFGLFSGAKLR